MPRLEASKRDDAVGREGEGSLGRPAGPQRRKARLRTELSEADESRLQVAAALFGLPKAEVVRRLIRASVEVGPALSADNTEAVVVLAAQVRRVGRNLMQLLRAIHRGQAVRIEDTEAVWSELNATVVTIDRELTELTLAYGSRLRRAAGLAPERDAAPAEVGG